MPEHTEPDPDDTSLDLELIGEDEGLELEPGDDESDDAYVWDASPEDATDPGGTSAGTSEGTSAGTKAGSMSGGAIESSGIDRQAANELGLGWMDDEDLRDLSPSLRGLGEDEILRIKQQRTAEVKKQLTSVGGQFVIGLLVGLVTVAAIILGATNWQNNAYLIPAGVITPFGLWYTFTRWKRWIGTAPYFYRLMTSLGEDAENLKIDHSRKKLLKAQKDMRKHANR